MREIPIPWHNQTPKRWSVLLLSTILSACVTINVYFPAAAAEQAADKIIEEVWGRLPPGVTRDRTTPPATTPPQSQLHGLPVLFVVLDALITPAHAQDINISTAAINQLKSRMSKRHNQLKAFYNSGAVGLTDKGDIAVRDLKAAALRDRNKVKKLVQEENNDRARLYKEIAKANGQPAWEKDIRATFARRWINNAQSGWYYLSNGRWRKK